MKSKRRIASFLLAGVVLAAAAYFALAYLPMSLLPLQQKPTPQPIYDYYEILDETNGESLMTIPLVVNIGDELITDDNRRFEVVIVIENKALARQVKHPPKLPEEEEKEE